MADSDVNLKALQRVDPYIVEIVDSATQVALYKFNSNDNEWDKTGVEGTLFVYRRSAPPYHGFIIMNRLSKTNQVEPITRDLELQREDPYLLYRNPKLNIFGIWFYDRKEGAKISESTLRLLQKEKERSRPNQRVRRASESDTSQGEQQSSMSVDILSLLSKAQEIYVKKAAKDVSRCQTSEPKKISASPTSGNTTTAELIRPRALRISGAPDVTRTSPTASKQPSVQEESLTVEELFASATKSSSGSVGGNSTILDSLVASDVKPQQPSSPSSQYHHDNSSTVPSNPVLLRLMSNPEHLVEHIERRQRNEFSSSLTTSLTAKSLEKDLRETLKLGLTSNGSPEQVKLIDVSADQNSSDTTGNLKSSSSVPVPPVLTPAMLESSLPGLPTTPNGGMNVSSSGQSPHSVATPFMFSKLAKPPLMSPMMFLAGIPLASTVKETVDGQWNSSDSKVTSTEESRPKDAEFLTKSQLVQALVYMLKNDSEFVNKLHEAYIKSLVELTTLRKS